MKKKCKTERKPREVENSGFGQGFIMSTTLWEVFSPCKYNLQKCPVTTRMRPHKRFCMRDSEYLKPQDTRVDVVLWHKASALQPLELVSEIVMMTLVS